MSEIEGHTLSAIAISAAGPWDVFLLASDSTLWKGRYVQRDGSLQWVWTQVPLQAEDPTPAVMVQRSWPLGST